MPTYCEAENLANLIPRITQVLNDSAISAEIIVVDDQSPDGTADLCQTLSQSSPLHLITRENERGLSTAVIAGMDAASAEILMVMDADLSHPPETIPELYSALKNQQADFVIGSRYVNGGSTDETWGWFRKFNSKIATWMARPFTTVKDPMAGFFALHRQDFLNAREILNPVGYKIGLELMVKCRCRNIIEIPIHFTDRTQGSSKLSFKEQINYLKHLKRLFEFKYRNYAYFAQFAVIGCSGVVVNLVALSLLLNWFNRPVAIAVAIWISMSTNFLLNRNITFSYARYAPILKQYLGYCSSCLLGAFFNWLTTMVLCSSITYFEKRTLLAALIGIVVGMTFNFILCRYFVFSKHKTASRSQKTV
ncbi:Undecaprenyl-phosphate mannosyltransferase [Gimesia aquarii]|uniref:Undecaprenyl-phosphate mannosyltransferase n=1 Tax=Gimesia aquarii TaxID=2527964 RepID=A0A517VSZ5_9PLAN|nr:Undecaprenyl-phosphate mannosyltransferase [Gimesia aquarii]